MSTKPLMILALTLGMSSIAFAQTTQTTPEGQAGGAMGGAESFTMPQGWEGSIGTSLFSDPTTGTAHSKEDLSKNWSTMSAEDQGKVKDYCTSLNMGSSATGGNGGAATGTTPADNTGAADTHASIRQICDDIKDL